MQHFCEDRAPNHVSWDKEAVAAKKPGVLSRVGEGVCKLFSFLLSDALLPQGSKLPDGPEEGHREEDEQVNHVTCGNMQVHEDSGSGRRTEK